MEILTVYRTADGQLHETEKQAKAHADNRYGQAMLTMAHKLVRIHKYRPMVDFLQENLEEFERIRQLKADIEVENDPDDAGNRETVDEFEDRSEARAMLDEYTVSDPAGNYRMSRRPLPEWED